MRKTIALVLSIVLLAALFAVPASAEGQNKIRVIVSVDKAKFNPHEVLGIGGGHIVYQLSLFLLLSLMFQPMPLESSRRYLASRRSSSTIRRFFSESPLESANPAHPSQHRPFHGGELNALRLPRPGA